MTTDKRSLSVSELGLTTAVAMALKRAGINTLGDLLDKPVHELLTTKDIGIKTFESIEKVVINHGEKLNETPVSRASKLFPKFKTQMTTPSTYQRKR